MSAIDLRLVNSAGNRRGLNAKHGEARDGAWTPEYRAWMGMKGRCFTTTNPKYPRYGGRGITVCSEWIGDQGFERFLEHVGRRPSPRHSIDRRDNNRDYDPGNVRWATRSEQSQNKSDTRLLTVDGRTLCISAWSRETGIGESTIRARIKTGWSTRDAVKRPLRSGYGR